MAACRITNLLPSEFPRRGEIESAIRDAFEILPSNSWEVTVRRCLGPARADQVAVELKTSKKSVAFASVRAGDSGPQIAERLKLFNLTA